MQAHVEHNHCAASVAAQWREEGVEVTFQGLNGQWQQIHPPTHEDGVACAKAIKRFRIVSRNVDQFTNRLVPSCPSKRAAMLLRDVGWC